MRPRPYLILAALLALAACAGTSTQQSTGESFDDRLITNNVRTALINERGVASTQIHVETFRGVVQLSGFVDSHEIATRAVNATRHVSGVKAVENNMTVKSDIRTDVRVPPSAGRSAPSAGAPVVDRGER